MPESKFGLAFWSLLSGLVGLVVCHNRKTVRASLSDGLVSALNRIGTIWYYSWIFLIDIAIAIPSFLLVYLILFSHILPTFHLA